MNDKLLEVLACPKCDDRPPLTKVGDRLVCTKCHWAFPVINGMPHLVSDEAIPPEQNDE